MNALPLVLSLATAWAPPPQGAQTGVFIDGELFTGADALMAPTAPASVFTELSLDRLAVGGGAMYERVIAVYAQFETIRSATPLSAFGIDKDSLLPRARLAYGQLTPKTMLFDVPLALDARLGLVPDIWLESIERRGGARGLLQMPSERSGLLVSSDLGATASLDVAAGLIVATVAVTNGEGLNEVERNAGKDLSAVLAVAHSVFDIAGTAATIGAQAMYRDGSIGVTPVRNNRVAAALFFDHRLVHIVGEGVLGLGSAGRANQLPAVVGARVDAQLIPSFLGAVAAYDLDLGDTSVKGTATQRASLGAFTDLGLDGNTGPLERARIYLVADARIGGTTAGPVPGVAGAGDLYTARVVLEMDAGTGVLDLMPKDRP